MQTQRMYLADLQRAISADRFGAYTLPSDVSELDAFARYLWNVALSEALFPVLQALEVTLRNSLHTAVARHGGTAMWFDAVPSILYPSELSKIGEAKGKLLLERKPVDAGHVVAELTFGFWTSLLDKRYERKLWPSLLKSTFPGMPRHIRTRGELSKRLNRIRKLRNRVFHHESILKWGAPDLVAQHTEIQAVIGWMSTPMRDTIGLLDRFDTVYANGPAFYRHSLDGQLGTMSP